ncbi:MAG: hypothetical protein EBS19_08225, partial [Spirochaetia bacterium]|nr:hypothetical protein [Spirochaetia bacterium]
MIQNWEYNKKNVKRSYQIPDILFGLTTKDDSKLFSGTNYSPLDILTDEILVAAAPSLITGYNDQLRGQGFPEMTKGSILMYELDLAAVFGYGHAFIGLTRETQDGKILSGLFDTNYVTFLLSIAYLSSLIAYTETDYFKYEVYPLVDNSSFPSTKFTNFVSELKDELKKKKEYVKKMIMVPAGFFSSDELTSDLSELVTITETPINEAKTMLTQGTLISDLLDTRGRYEVTRSSMAFPEQNTLAFLNLTQTQAESISNSIKEIQEQASDHIRQLKEQEEEEVGRGKVWREKREMEEEEARKIRPYILSLFTLAGVGYMYSK